MHEDHKNNDDITSSRFYNVYAPVNRTNYGELSNKATIRKGA